MISFSNSGKYCWIYLKMMKVLIVSFQFTWRQKKSYDQMHQILWPNLRHFTGLVNLCTHDKVCHGGTEIILNEMRLKYWQIKGLQTMRKIISMCYRSTSSREGLTATTSIVASLVSCCCRFPISCNWLWLRKILYTIKMFTPTIRMI